MKMNAVNGGKIVKLLGMAVVLIAAAAMLPAQAKAADSIGMLDVRKVAQAHPLYLQWQKDLDKLKLAREQQVEEMIKKKFNLPDNPADAKLTDDQIKEIQQIQQDENQKFTSEMEPQWNQKMKEVEDDIIGTVKTVAQKKGLSVVLDSSTVIFGGVDITDDVIAAVTKNAPAPAPSGDNN